MNKNGEFLGRSLSLSKSEFFQALAMFALGLVLLIFPGLAYDLIFSLVGTAIIIVGLLGVLRYFKLDSQAAVGSTQLATGLITVVLGVLVILFRNSLVSLLPLAFGLILLAGGIFKLQRALGLRSLGAQKWFIELLISLLCIVLGVVVVFNPFRTATTLTRLVGAGLVVESAAGVISGGIFRKLLNK